MVKMSDAPRGVSERMLRLTGFPEQVQAAMNLVQVCLSACAATLAAWAMPMHHAVVDRLLSPHARAIIMRVSFPGDTQTQLLASHLISVVVSAAEWARLCEVLSDRSGLQAFLLAGGAGSLDQAAALTYPGR